MTRSRNADSDEKLRLVAAAENVIPRQRTSIINQIKKRLGPTVPLTIPPKPAPVSRPAPVTKTSTVRRPISRNQPPATPVQNFLKLTEADVARFKADLERIKAKIDQGREQGDSKAVYAAIAKLRNSAPPGSKYGAFLDALENGNFQNVKGTKLDFDKVMQDPMFKKWNQIYADVTGNDI